MNREKLYATVSTPGYINIQLHEWLVLNRVNHRPFEVKGREYNRLSQLYYFLQTGKEWWLLLNHYAHPQFSLTEVPETHTVCSALIRQNKKGTFEPLHGEVLHEQENWLQVDMVPTGCLFLHRMVAEDLHGQRTFEYTVEEKEKTYSGESGDITMSKRIRQAGHTLWVWKRRCLNRQEVWI